MQPYSKDVYAFYSVWFVDPWDNIRKDTERIIYYRKSALDPTGEIFVFVLHPSKENQTRQSV